MGRSFIIRPRNDKIIQLEELLETMQNLPEFPPDLKHLETFRSSINDFCFRVPGESYAVFLNRLPSGVYHCGNRVLDYHSNTRKLFLAVTCACTILTEGSVSSIDGAWYNPDKAYSGGELWEEFITLKDNFQHQSIFVRKDQLEGTCYLEFQICEKKHPLRNGKTSYKNVQFWKEDSLYLDMNDIEEYNKFYELCAGYFQNGVLENGQRGFDPYGIMYYSPEETENIRQALEHEPLPELLDFLEGISMMQNFNGFYILGI